jgi:sodium/potassium/calcium exchanger 2
MCSLLTKEVLTLTWWPLFRDSSYYTVGLVVLAVFSGVVSPNIIELWEAIVLFIMYIGYILIMWQNANLYKALTGKVLEYPDEDCDDSTGQEEQDDVKETPKDGGKGIDEEKPSTENGSPGREELQQNGLKKTPSKGSVLSQLSADNLHRHEHPPHFRWQGTFRAGILKLLKDPNSWLDTAGVGIVSKIVGDADYVFQQVDIDGNGHVDREELKQLFNLLECYVSPQELEEVFNELDTDGDGTVSFFIFLERTSFRVLMHVAHHRLFPHPKSRYRLVKRNSPNGTVNQKKESCLKSVMYSTRLMLIIPTRSTKTS